MIFHLLWNTYKLVQVKAMVQGRDRRPELGYKLALECRRNINYPMKNKNSKYVIKYKYKQIYKIIHTKTNTHLSSTIKNKNNKYCSSMSSSKLTAIFISKLSLHSSISTIPQYQLYHREEEQQVGLHDFSDRRYNNMQVNPDGSLATNQTNESNHNTAKVEMIEKVEKRIHQNLTMFLFSNSNTILAKVIQEREHM